MSNVSTFGAFTMAKLGIYASQKAMQVTGNNITNINTPGYTRQTLDLQSLYVGGADRYASKWDQKIGTGVLVTGVNQIRSPYLDIRYRTENSTVGKEEKTLDVMNGLASILDEVAKGEDGEGIMEAAFQDMIEQLTHYTTSGAGEATFDTVFKGSASQVVNIFNTYAKKLEDLYNNTKATLHDDVITVNGLLSDIRSLNNAIRKAEIHGSNALELKDTRNLKIDELSKYIRINVIYEEENLGAGCIVDKLTIRLDSNDPKSEHNGMLLVDGKYATQLKVPDVNVPEERPAPVDQKLYDVTLDALRDVKGKPKLLVEGNPTVCVSDRYSANADDKDANHDLPLPNGGTLKIGGFEATNIKPPDPQKTPAEQIEDQLREFCKQYNENTNNTQWRATMGMNKDCVVFTSTDSWPTPPDEVDTTTIQPLTKSGELKIAGFTANITVDPNDPNTQTLASQLDQFLAQYKKANPSIEVNHDTTTNKITFSMDALTEPGEITLNGYTAFIKNAASMTLEQQLAAFRDAYNNDPDNDPDYATLSGNRLIFTTERREPVEDAQKPDGTRMVTLGVKDVPDPNNLETELTDTDLYGALQATREMLTEEGEFASAEDLIRDPNAASKRGIPYYTKIWDAMARKFADTLNDANTLEDANGDLKKYTDGDKKGQYIVKPENYYKTNEKGEYVDADGNPIAPGEWKINSDDFTAYKTFEMDPTGTKFLDKDGNVIDLQPGETYQIFATNDDDKHLDKYGNVIEPDPFMGYQKNAEGKYVDNDGNVVEPNPDGSYDVYLSKDGNYVDKNDNVITPNWDGSYWEYETKNGAFVDAAGNPITPDPEQGYSTYKTATDNNGVVWYVGEDGTQLGKVGDGVPGGAVVTGDLRVPTKVDRRIPTGKDRRGEMVDRRVVIDDKRVITGDKRVVRDQYKGGVLFSNNGDNNNPKDITAKNISISLGWRTDAIHVMQSRDDTELDTSTANSNILHMVSIVKDNNFSFMLSDMDPAFGTPGNPDIEYFKGSFADMLTEIDSQLGMDAKETQTRLATAATDLTELEVDRDSVSGVDLNDEAIAMMQYNKSYSAACRFMTTLDEMLDKLINGTAI